MKLSDIQFKEEDGGKFVFITLYRSEKHQAEGEWKIRESKTAKYCTYQHLEKMISHCLLKAPDRLFLSPCHATRNWIETEEPWYTQNLEKIKYVQN